MKEITFSLQDSKKILNNMTNWKTFKIENIKIWDYCDSILFELENGQVRFYNPYNTGISYTFQEFIICANSYPFSDWQVGDRLEIDVDKTCNYKDSHTFNDTSIVRKVGSSSVMPSSSAISLPSVSQNQVNTMIGQINSAINSDERNEYEAKVHVDPNSGKYSGFSMIGRRK